MPNALMQDCPRLSPQIHLQCGATQGFGLLLGPTGAVQLNANAEAILKLCDGTRNSAEIIWEFARRLGRPVQTLAKDVQDFLGVALNHGWIIDDSQTGIATERRWNT
jgi:pyrroloquinoline quinone biosynthesis protein D